MSTKIVGGVGKGVENKVVKRFKLALEQQIERDGQYEVNLKGQSISAWCLDDDIALKYGMIVYDALEQDEIYCLQVNAAAYLNKVDDCKFEIYIKRHYNEDYCLIDNLRDLHRTEFGIKKLM
jgi:hypothetical protein